MHTRNPGGATSVISDRRTRILSSPRWLMSEISRDLLSPSTNTLPLHRHFHPSSDVLFSPERPCKNMSASCVEPATGSLTEFSIHIEVERVHPRSGRAEPRTKARLIFHEEHPKIYLWQATCKTNTYKKRRGPVAGGDPTSFRAAYESRSSRISGIRRITRRVWRGRSRKRAEPPPAHDGGGPRVEVHE
ncbi:hypothetical protein EVAR_59143_1 [Eumeta japonica]|uniref:Uncharacterized protein n=1 Tax=Eumeta variegata TaxID=151549 RepID=A0A4C1ZD84_EUMVA|nr:hypothetical protein EVAR_59143_1 [Eumeta japonica]